MKVYNVDNFAVLIGIDWADQKHDVCEHSLDSGKYKYSIIKSKPEALYDWAMSLKNRYPNQKIAVVCELKKGPLIYALNKYDHLTLFTINPSTVAKYRKAFTPSGAKDDPSDAFVQVEILTLHMDKLTVIEPESAAIASYSIGEQ